MTDTAEKFQTPKQRRDNSKPRKSDRAPKSRKDQFIELWQKSDSAVEVAQRMDISIRTAHTMAWKLRNDGYALKAMPRGRPKTDTDSPATAAVKQSVVMSTWESLPIAVREAIVAQLRKELLQEASFLGRLDARRKLARKRKLAKARAAE